MKTARTSHGVGFDALTCRFSRRLHDQVAGDAVYAAALTHHTPAPGILALVARFAAWVAVLALVVVAVAVSAFWY